MARPRKTDEVTLMAKPNYMINMEYVNNVADIKAVLAYLTKDLKIPQDGDITGIAHLVDLK